MGFFEASFEIVEASGCPMYGPGEWFHLSGLAFVPPKGKPACLFLARELTEYVLKSLGEEQFTLKRRGRDFFNCSGCTGLIKFREKKKENQQFATPHMRLLAAADAKQQTHDIESISSLLNSFALFQIIDEENLADIVTHLKVKEYESGQHVINKGDDGNYLYIVLTGKVNVVSDGRIIACLGRGEIFGEMSLLTGKPVGASIVVVDSAKILSISNEQFRQLVIKYPTIQMGITKILAQRLSDSNLQKSAGKSATFAGDLTDISVAELCQLLHSNSKTGTISFVFGGKKGRVIFYDGEIVKADYGDLSDREAFFAFLQEENGQFEFVSQVVAKGKKFPAIAPFMGLLMEGLQKVDEEKEARDS